MAVVSFVSFNLTVKLLIDVLKMIERDLRLFVCAELDRS